MKFDWSKFKKIDSNRDHTVLQSEEGHIVHISNKALQKDMLEALNKLPVVQKLYQGGQVKKIQAPGTKKEQDKVSEGFKNALGFKKMKNGGEVGVDGEEVQNEELLKVLGAADKGALLKQSGQISEDVPNSQAGQHIATMPLDQQASLVASSLPQAMDQQEQGDLVPATPPAEEAVAQEAPQEQAMPGQQTGQQLDDIFNRYAQGMRGETTAAKTEAKSEAGILGQAVEQLQQQQEKLQQAETNIIGQNAQLVEDMKNMPTDAVVGRRSFAGMLASAIGIMIGGAPIVAAINRYIDQDVQEQMQERSKKENLFKKNLELLGSTKAAADMTKLNLLTMTELKIKEAAQKGVSQAALPKLQQQLAELDLKKQKLIKDLAQNQIQNQALLQAQQAKGPEAKYGEIINQLERVNPKLAESYRARLTPVGFANTTEDAKQAKQLIGDSDVSRGSIDRLLQIANVPYKSLDLSLREEASAIANTLIGSLRVPVTGPGAMNESEKEILQSLARNPTKFLSLDVQNKKALKTLKDWVNRSERERLQAMGLKPKATNQFSSTGRKVGK